MKRGRPVKAIYQREGLLKTLMDEYPCLKCPFDSYSRKVDTKMRTCDKLEMEKLYGEEY